MAWEAYEHHPQTNTSDWYWSVGIITTAVVIICVLWGNILLALLIGFGVGMLAYFSSRPPAIVDVDITTQGIRYGEHFYDFNYIASYFIDGKDTSSPRLILRSRKMIMPYITIRLDSIHHTEVEDALAGRIEEDNHPEPFIYKILERFGF